MYMYIGFSEPQLFAVNVDIIHNYALCGRACVNIWGSKSLNFDMFSATSTTTRMTIYRSI